MALFDFKCDVCGCEFEVERPLGAKGTVKCVKCASTKTSKVFSAAGIVFKGSGFYVTDSKSPPAETKSGEAKPETAKPAETTGTVETAAPAKAEPPTKTADKS